MCTLLYIMTVSFDQRRLFCLYCFANSKPWSFNQRRLLCILLCKQYWVLTKGNYFAYCFANNKHGVLTKEDYFMYHFPSSDNDFWVKEDYFAYCFASSNIEFCPKEIILCTTLWAMTLSFDWRRSFCTLGCKTFNNIISVHYSI